ncbi:MAG: TetR/AcrR family transcriptional regulator [Synergistaceae bacterium]|nr:TetR/AcrR family transcriptional regulator [Synergistaceae bacterium]
MEKIRTTKITEFTFDENAGKHSGRPKKSGVDNSSRTALINAAAAIIAREGTTTLTVRSVCSEAGVSTGTFYYFFHDKNELMMNFIREPLFNDVELVTPIKDLSGRISELYLILIKRYMNLGRNFVRSFYNPENKFLSAYMGERDGKFLPGTVMERSERELNLALKEKILNLPASMNVHKIALGLSSIVKGCLFEWCLNANINVEELTEFTIRNYLFRYV